MLQRLHLLTAVTSLAVTALPILGAVPVWSGAGAYRLCVRVDPVDLHGRPQDELVARCSLNLAQLLADARAAGQVDLATLQVQQYDPKTGRAREFRPFDNRHGEFDRPCRFDDDTWPDAYPDRIGAASEAQNGRPPITTRLRGGRLFNREMDNTSGQLVWVHTQSKQEPSYYCIYFGVKPRGEPTGPSPAPWIGDVDLYRRETGAPIGGMSHWNICAADYNGDGLFDLFAGCEKGNLMYFPNHGSPGHPWFTGCRMLADETGPIDTGWYCAPFVTDWNGDGLPDLLVGTMHDAIVWWKNTGTKTSPKLTYQGFVQADGERLKVPASPVAEDTAGIFKVDYYNAPTVCDWDGDGLPDILTGGYSTGRIFYYRCTGRGPDGVPNLKYVGPIEADGRALDVGWSATPTVYDLDGDGKLDLITGSWDFQKPHNPDTFLNYYKNVGTSGQPRLERQPFPREGAFPPHIVARAAVADWNNDGLPDLLVSDHSGTTSLLLNKGTRTAPRFACDGSSVTGSWGFVPLDLSQDPEDYVILTYDYMITSMTGRDRDGNIEIMSGDQVFALAGSPNSPSLVRRGLVSVGEKRLLNPGPGYGDEYNWNVFDDWDQDGTVDILCGTQQGNIFFHKGLGGSGPLQYAPGVRFKLKTGEDLKVGPPVYDDPKRVRDFVDLQGSRIKFIVSDVDGDGIDDLVVTETYDNVWVFRNTVRGGLDRLEPGVNAFKVASRSRLSTLDWNHDGKPDIIDGNTLDKPGTIHINQSSPGRIQFAAPTQPLNLPWVFYGAGFFPMDWNGDGDEDFLIQSEFYLFWAERSFIEHGYCAATALGGIEIQPQTARPHTVKTAAACLNSEMEDPAENPSFICGLGGAWGFVRRTVN